MSGQTTLKPTNLKMNINAINLNFSIFCNTFLGFQFVDESENLKNCEKNEKESLNDTIY